MLTGFFKEHDEGGCNCQLIKFADRIFIDQSGDARLIRLVVLEVLASSPDPLKGFKMLTPVREPLSLKDHSALLLDESDRYNSRGLAGNYAVSQPFADTKNAGFREGLFSMDGIGSIVAFEAPGLSNIDLAGDTILRYRFPRALAPGEKVAVRLGFSVGSLAENTSVGALGETVDGVVDMRLRLSYLERRNHEQALQELNPGHCEIPIVPILGTRLEGGFDIMVGFPDTLEVSMASPRKYEQKALTSDEDGLDGVVYIWRLRELVDDVHLPVTVGSGPGWKIECMGIRPPDATASEVRRLQTDVASLQQRSVEIADAVETFRTGFAESLEKLRSNISAGTKLGVLALLVSLIGLLVSCRR